MGRFRPPRYRQKVNGLVSSEFNGKTAKRLTGWNSLMRSIRMDFLLYVLLIPGIAYFAIFKYAPMYGVIIGFKDYNIVSGLSNANWVGFAIFRDLFSRAAFQRAFRNNITISLLKILWGFPMPILLSLLINEVRSVGYKKYIQTTVILPHFISWFIIYGMLYALCNLSTGAIPQVLRSLNSSLGTTIPVVNYLAQKETFLNVLLLSYLWQSSGYGTIVYLAAITGIDQQLYEAAMIDGAGKIRQMWHVTLPCLRPTIIIMLIFRVGSIMNAGFDQVFAMSNSLVVSVADIIDTYVYRIGMEEAKFSLATAAGLTKSVIGLVLVLGTNWIAKKVDPDSGIM